MTSMRYCRACGTKLDADASFCVGCGKSVAEDPANKQPIRTTNKKFLGNRSYFQWASLCAVIISGLVYFSTTVWLKSEQIEGKVEDVFGNPLADVVVSIDALASKTTSGRAGDYSIDYTPGSFNLEYAKEGFLKQRLRIEIGEKKSYSAKTVILYPHPSVDGIHFIDREGLQLSIIPANTMSRQLVHGVNSRGENRISHGIICDLADCENSYRAVPKLKSGDVQFILNNVLNHRLYKVDRFSGQFYGYEHLRGVYRNFYQNVPDVKVISIISEQLSVISVNLDPGVYAWVPYQKKSGMERPIPVAKTFTFAVEDNSRDLAYYLDGLKYTLSDRMPEEKDALEASRWIKLDSNILMNFDKSFDSIYLHKLNESSNDGRQSFLLLAIGEYSNKFANPRDLLDNITYRRGELSHYNIYCKDQKFQVDWKYNYYDESVVVEPGLPTEDIRFDDAGLAVNHLKLMLKMCEI